MRRLQPLLLASTLAATLASPFASPSVAYESKCYVGVNACAPGPEASRNTWVGSMDEHRQVWEATSPLALPPAADDPFTLRLFTGKGPTNGGLPTMKPVDFREATLAINRPGPHTVAEFTQLPDFAYSLWDWAMGMETCPLSDFIDAIDCHTFETHLGPMNSSHFPPQAREFYRHYHDLAKARAKDCNAMGLRLGASASRFDEFLRECEQEALVLEAVGQHFLQDSWSMGHMWERWGSPEPSDILADLNSARVVGAMSGLLHGARGAMQGLIPGADVADPMCAPDGDVGWLRPGIPSPPIPAVGDDYWSLVEADYPEQIAQIRSCTTAGMRDVMSLISNPVLGGHASAPTVDPLSPSCFGQRASNLSMLVGSSLDFVRDDTTVRIAFDAVGPSVVPTLVEQSQDPATEAAQRLDMIRVASRIRTFATVAPQGVELASGALPPLFGFGVNGQYANRVPIASYVEPPLPWPARKESEPRSLALARLFHRAHAADWCQEMNLDYLAGLKRHVATASKGVDAGEIAASAEACTEFVRRHAVGINEAGNPITEAPLCELATTGSPSLVNRLTENAAATPGELAAQWCSCGNGAVDDGEECDPSAPSGDAACPGACRPVNHSRLIAGNKVYDDCRCSEICDDQKDNDGDGDIDCDDADCDGDKACTPTRIFFSVCSTLLDPAAKVYSMNPDGSDVKLLKPEGAGVRVSPDGRRVAAITGSSRVSTFNVDGSGRHDITVDGQPEALAWSPEGESLVILAFGQDRERSATERNLQTVRDRSGGVDDIWHLGDAMGSGGVDWVGDRWLFTYARNGPLSFLNGVSTATAFSESRQEVFHPYDKAQPAKWLVGTVRLRPDGTPSWSGYGNGTYGLIVNGVLWLATNAFGYTAYSPDGAWAAGGYTNGIAVYRFNGSSAYNAYFGTGLCGLDWAPAP